ncbi:MAG: D-TA family PLP-dependent enzyme [Chitinophagaceae bacterium]
MEWYEAGNIDIVDSPALVLYPHRIKKNITNCISLVSDLSLLRPHIKTNKIAEVCQLMLDAGIRKFKCATIAEAEMLGMINAPDVLLAYQPVGPKISRFLELISTYPSTKFSCLVDQEVTASHLDIAAIRKNEVLNVFIDLNTGMDRTGILPSRAFDLFCYLENLKGIKPVGLHTYDGQLHDTNPAINESKAAKGFADVLELSEKIKATGIAGLTIAAGGSVTFPYYRLLDVECSPGTFVFWDWSYKHLLPQEPFDYAAVIISRVISIVSDSLITIDLGHKSIASENPLPRVHFLNAPQAVPVSHSEEHLVLQVPTTSDFKPGDVLYGIPDHICPSVSMYEEAFVCTDHIITGSWQITARDKKITI